MILPVCAPKRRRAVRQTSEKMAFGTHYWTAVMGSRLKKAALPPLSRAMAETQLFSPVASLFLFCCVAVAYTRCCVALWQFPTYGECHHSSSVSGEKSSVSAVALIEMNSRQQACRSKVSVCYSQTAMKIRFSGFCDSQVVMHARGHVKFCGFPCHMIGMSSMDQPRARHLAVLCTCMWSSLTNSVCSVQPHSHAKYDFNTHVPGMRACLQSRVFGERLLGLDQFQNF